MSGSGGFLVAGRIGRPHGLDGSFHVTRPRGRLLPLGGVVVLDGAATEIVRRAGTEDRPILRLAVASDREAIEALRGSDLLVARADAPPLEEEEWYAEDIEGCAVRDTGRGVEVGVVARLLPLPANEVLEVRRDGAAPLLVPLIRDCVRSVDVAAGVIDIDLGFLGEDA